MATYFKITNSEEIHNGFVYTDGLNVLLEPFNNDPNESCVAGGFYFTTLEYINKFYSYGVNLREVFLPTDDPEFKMIKDPQGDKWRANKIILGKKYSLYDPKTYELGLDMTRNNKIIDLASKHGNIEFLEWWKKSALELKYSIDSMDLASRNGHVNVLEWWHKSGLELKYSTDTMDSASRNGHVNVLEWWHKSGLELKYFNLAIDLASSNRHVNVLEWWHKSGLELKYSTDSIDLASRNGLTDIREWWHKSGLKYSPQIFNKKLNI